ncbi:MAG: thiamine pyrophosphate-dependent dehydrogenase E1 component subunit alpha, partial [Dehalococcoidales bacterium]|nr:thiamine pyrophosphate-dependent dehydrogenase E1 component subunit alpha [Dehalococcoidales bacterium]
MPVTKEIMLKMYTLMIRSHKFDELMIKSITNGKLVAFYHSLRGEEAVEIGGALPLRKDDYLYGTHRGHSIGYILAKGGAPLGFIAEHYGKKAGMANGVSGFHIVDEEIGILGLGGTIGTVFPTSLGFGVAAKKNGRGQVVGSYFGDGASNRAVMHTSLNLSAVWKLPIIWFCENNLYAMAMPLKDAYPKADIADIAGSYGMPGVVVDGQDVVAVYEVVEAAVARARAGEGPSLIEAKTYRFHSHAMGMPRGGPNETASKEEMEAWMKRDPIKLFEDKLLIEGILTQEDIK